MVFRGNLQKRRYQEMKKIAEYLEIEFQLGKNLMRFIKFHEPSSGTIDPFGGC